MISLILCSGAGCTYRECTTTPFEKVSMNLRSATSSLYSTSCVRRLRKLRGASDTDLVDICREDIR
jgi:hypothetical protein